MSVTFNKSQNVHEHSFILTLHVNRVSCNQTLGCLRLYGDSWVSGVQPRINAYEILLQHDWLLFFSRHNRFAETHSYLQLSSRATRHSAVSAFTETVEFLEYTDRSEVVCCQYWLSIFCDENWMCCHFHWHLRTESCGIQGTVISARSPCVEWSIAQILSPAKISPANWALDLWPVW